MHCGRVNILVWNVFCHSIEIKLQHSLVVEGIADSSEKKIFRKENLLLKGIEAFKQRKWIKMILMMMMMLSKQKSGLSTRCFAKVQQQEVGWRDHRVVLSATPRSWHFCSLISGNVLGYHFKLWKIMVLSFAQCGVILHFLISWGWKWRIPVHSARPLWF